MKNKNASKEFKIPQNGTQMGLVNLFNPIRRGK